MASPTKTPRAAALPGLCRAIHSGTQHVQGVGPWRYDDEEETHQMGPDVDDSQTLKHDAPLDLENSPVRQAQTLMKPRLSNMFPPWRVMNRITAAGLLY